MEASAGTSVTLPDRRGAPKRDLLIEMADGVFPKVSDAQ